MCLLCLALQVFLYVDVVLPITQSVIYEYCTSCQKRLQWIVQVGAKRGLRKPNTDEVRQAKVNVIFYMYLLVSVSSFELLPRQ